MRSMLAVLAACATTVVPAPARATAPEPQYWSGPYGPAPYFARQVVQDPDWNTCADWEPSETDRLLALVLRGGGRTCQRFVVQPGSTSGSDYVAELVLCRAPRSSSAESFPGGSPELQYDVADFDAGQSVNHWQDPATYTPSGFALQPGDCAVYLLIQPMLKADGTPLTSGHRHHLTYRHMNGSELVSDGFVAP